MTDEGIIHAIQAGGPERERALQQVYLRAGLREAVYKCVRDYGADEQTAQDVFQEAFVLFDRNVRAGKFEGRSAISTYIVAIAKWHWANMRRQQGRYVELKPLEVENEMVDSPEIETIAAEQRAMLLQALEHIGERCKGLLTLYQLNYSMTEIATLMGYQNPEVAKKEAYRCRLKLRERLIAYEWKNNSI